MSHTSPLLFDVIEGERGAAQTVVTLNVSQHVHRKARRVMDRGHRLAIRARPRKRYELTVRDPSDQALSLMASGNSGAELHTAAERLIEHAHGVLFDPLPW